MLGRLKMSIDEAIKAYQRFAETVFAGYSTKFLEFLEKGFFYKGSVLEECIKEIVKERTGDSESSFLDGDEGCKVYVDPFLFFYSFSPDWDG